MTAFVMCNACKVMPEAHMLCDGCMRNRDTITCLETEVDNLKSHLEAVETKVVGLRHTQTVLRDLIIDTMREIT